MRSFTNLFSVTAIVALAAATATATASASSAATTLHSRLSELRQAFKYNLITNEEFAKTKAEVLAAFSSSPANVGNSKLKLQPNAEAEAEAEGGSPFTNLVFSDDFSGPLDLEKWEHEITMGGGGNWEFEYYLNNRSNSFTRNGTLFLKPTLTSDTLSEAQVVNGGSVDLWGSQPADICTGNAFFGCSRASNGVNIINPIQSARIRTAKSFSFKYGRVEVRAKLPKGDWIWPAIWMLPQQQAYGKWPASGEIDIMESRGNAAGYSAGGVDTFGSTLHFGPFYGEDRYDLAHAEKKAGSGRDFSQDFHVFGLEWSEDMIFTYLDDRDNVVLQMPLNESLWSKGGFDKLDGIDNPWEGSSQAAPFDQKFYLVLNVAVGGTNSYFPDGEGGKCWTNKSPQAALDFWNCKGQWYPTWAGDAAAMQVDYVKVWQ